MYHLLAPVMGMDLVIGVLAGVGIGAFLTYKTARG